jgi:hypothetical protein
MLQPEKMIECISLSEENLSEIKEAFKEKAKIYTASDNQI